MIASSIKNANAHDGIMLRRSAVEPSPPNVRNIQSIAVSDTHKVLVTLNELVEGDLFITYNVKIEGTTNHNGTWKVVAYDLTANTVIVVIPNGHLLAPQVAVAGTLKLFDEAKDFTLPGTPVRSDSGTTVGESYNVAGSFLHKIISNNNQAIQLNVISGSISCTFQLSIDRTNWTDLDVTLASITTTGFVVFHDMPINSYLRINATGTGTYYLLARDQ